MIESSIITGSGSRVLRKEAMITDFVTKKRDREERGSSEDKEGIKPSEKSFKMHRTPQGQIGIQ